jgi:5-methylcytosine-specific restriction endonuclease McrA
MPWDTSARRQRLPADWYTEIRPTVLDGRPCQIRWDDGCQVVATEVDHIRPGDDHRMSNLQPACSWCHGKKSSAEGHAARRYFSSRRRPERHPGLR